MEADSKGVVEFKATAFSLENPWCLHEVSRFVKEEGQGLYVDGTSRTTPLQPKEGCQRLAGTIPVIAAAARNSRSAVGVEVPTDAPQHNMNSGTSKPYLLRNLLMLSFSSEVFWNRR
jgi:hypothetical protein